LVVIKNSGIKDTPVQLTSKGIPFENKKTCVTSRNEDLFINEIGDGDAIIVSARSIMTTTTR
jgi:hypothetical protein